MSFDSSLLASFVTFVNDEASGVVATTASDGRPQAALVSLLALPDGVLLFNAFESSRKIANLRAHPDVAVVVGTSGAVTLQIEGRAREAGDLEASPLEAMFRARFPGARGRADGLVLVTITPSWARFYDASMAVPQGTEHHWDDLPQASS